MIGVFMRFKNKVVIVTGASRGIGKATALAFGKEGANVVVNYVKSETEANSVVLQIKKMGSKAIAVKCDVSNESSVKEMINKTVKEFGRLDILINNAGIVIDKPFANRTLDDWKRTLDTNLTGVFLCCKYASVQMLKQKAGKIVNVSSNNAFVTPVESTDYNATKAGVVNLTKSLAKELGPYILVNCVAPGWVDTDMNKTLPKKFLEKEFEKQVIKRFSKPEEQANAILFLASDEASYITGSTLSVDGGY
jgi:3-oxoacyl-[acyl-carrier protein] reductase